MPITVNSQSSAGGQSALKLIRCCQISPNIQKSGTMQASKNYSTVAYLLHIYRRVVEYKIC